MQLLHTNEADIAMVSLVNPLTSLCCDMQLCLHTDVSKRMTYIHTSLTSTHANLKDSRLCFDNVTAVS